MLDIVYGSSGQSPAERQLKESLIDGRIEGTLYFAYPLFDGSEGQTSADALLISRTHGLVLFDLTAQEQGKIGYTEWMSEIESRQDEIYRNITVKLYKNKELVSKRELLIKPIVITFFPDRNPIHTSEEIFVCTPTDVTDKITSFGGLSEQIERAVNATIQRVTTIKPQNKRANVIKNDSMGAILKKIEAGIANLDAWQKKSAIAYPEGPQRIRGLAGSGKTIVLALKAAYLHAKHPEWNIAITYYSRSLQQQFIDLIRRFMYETKSDEPDWSKLHIFHCWGSNRERGFYSEVASAYGVTPISWGEANRQFGKESFNGICQSLLSEMSKTKYNLELYDAILIDEAQDLPESFFKIAYSVSKYPKRIVWAYDELQNLGEYSMPSPEVLFGNDQQGEPLVCLRNDADRPPQDIVLPVCYRNTPWALTVAHGLGFGTTRRKLNVNTNLIQIFDDPHLWEDIGYEVTAGNLSLGNHVRLKRKADCSPKYFQESEHPLITSEDSIKFESFADKKQQSEWIAQQIRKNISEDELTHRDILIILPNAYTSKSEFASLHKELMEHQIDSHLCGITSSRDEVFIENSIAITHIYRAKGNEAAMVYIANSDECYSGLELAKKRNTLFTAITRSRAWVRVCGVGPESEQLRNEFEIIKNDKYNLDFDYPTKAEITKLRRIHRDRSEEEQRKIKQKVSDFSSIINQIKDGELSADALPPELIAALQNILPGNKR